MKAFENDIRVWQAASVQCDLAVKAKAESAVTAKERVDRSARVVLCNSENVAKLIDDLARLQAEIIEKRSALRFIWGSGLNGELSQSDKDRMERLLWRDLTALEPTDSSRAWEKTFETLMTDAAAELPTDYAGAV